MENKTRFKLDFDIRKATLLLIIIQSCGIRYFSGQGSFLSIIIIACCFQGIKKLTRKEYTILFWVIFFFFLNKLANPDFLFSKLIFQFILIFESIVFLKQYSHYSKLLDDLNYVLKFILIHAVVGYLLYFAIPFAFQSVSFGMSYKSFLYIFYIVGSQGLPRNTGLCWEPGLLQLLLNLYLFLSIKNSKSWKHLTLISIGIISTLSTTGFIILFLNYIYYITTTIKKRNTILPLLIITLLLLIPFSIIQSNIVDKLGGTNTSGLVRYRDYLIGLQLIQEKPFLGHGVFEAEYLLTKSYVSKIEVDIFSEGYLNTSGELSGGYTNGLLGLLAWYGLPAGLFLYILLFKNKIIDENLVGKLIFFLILMLSFLSEPITYTSFFLIFPLSRLVENTKIKRFKLYPAHEK